MTWIRSAGMPSIATMSRREHSETVMTASARLDADETSPK